MDLHLCYSAQEEGAADVASPAQEHTQFNSNRFDHSRGRQDSKNDLNTESALHKDLLPTVAPHIRRLGDLRIKDLNYLFGHADAGRCSPAGVFTIGRPSPDDETDPPLLKLNVLPLYQGECSS